MAEASLERPRPLPAWVAAPVIGLAAVTVTPGERVWQAIGGGHG